MAQQMSHLVLVEGPVDGWPGHREHLGQVGDGIVVGGMHPAEFLLRFTGLLGLFAAQLGLVSRNGHAPTGELPPEKRISRIIYRCRCHSITGISRQKFCGPA